MIEMKVLMVSQPAFLLAAMLIRLFSGWYSSGKVYGACQYLKFLPSSAHYRRVSQSKEKFISAVSGDGFGFCSVIL